MRTSTKINHILSEFTIEVKKDTAAGTIDLYLINDVKGFSGCWSDSTFTKAVHKAYRGLVAMKKRQDKIGITG